MFYIYKNLFLETDLEIHAIPIYTLVVFTSKSSVTLNYSLYDY